MSVLVKVAVTEDYAPTHEAMGFVSGNPFKAGQELFIDQLGAKLLSELMVVDGLHGAILVHLALDIPGVNALLLSMDWDGRV